MQTVQLCTLVDSASHAALNIPTNLPSPEALFTDIVQCFDVLPIKPSDPNSIVNKLNDALKIIDIFTPGLCFYSRYNPNSNRFHTTFSSTPTVASTPISTDQFLHLFQIMLDHNYVQVGNKFYTNQCGFPQGLAPGSKTVNAYLLTCNLQFTLQHMHNPAGRIKIARIFSHMYQYVDDIASLGSKTTETDLQEVYPPFIKFDSNTKKPLSLTFAQGTFLNLDIHTCLPDQIHHSVLFKEDKLPFTPVQYVKLESNRSINFCYNILIGQLYTAVFLNSNSHYFIQHLLKLVQIFASNGFSTPTLKSKIKKYYASKDFSAVAKFNVPQAVRSFLKHKQA